MANQSQTEPALNPKQSTMQAIAARIKVLRLLSVAAVALFLLVGTAAQADIFVSNYATGYVERWDDSGHVINSHFINTGPAHGAEGLACVKLMKNKIYAGNAQSSMIGVYDITTGTETSHFTVGTGSIAGLAFNITGTVLYVAEYGYPGQIFAVDPATGLCAPGTACSVTTPNAHDIVVGPDGNVYATEFDASGGSGVRVFNAALSNPPGALFIQPGQIPRAGGMVFDGAGNLWVTSTNPGSPYTAGIYEFAGPYSTSPNPGTQLNFTPDANAFPLGLDVSPVNPPGPPIDACKGCIVVAELNGAAGNGNGTISQINPTLCHSGTCPFNNHPYFTTGGAPKYVHFSENCCDTGYVEICKMSCLTNPVHGYFDFTATNSGVSIGPVHIPVNACSGPIQIPNGIVTIKEAQQLGIEVTNITAYNYDYLGNQINALLSFNLPFQTGNVDVVSGDVSTETVAGFTNCASGPGELKICKVAGPGVQVGTLFSFTAQGFGPPMTYQVPAGPAPGGYCVVGASYQVGTPVLVTETGPQGYVVSNITVAPPDRGGTQTSNSVVAIIDSGTTEVTFTNTVHQTPFYNNLGPPGNLYQCGSNPFNSGWPVSGSGSPLLQSYTQANPFTAAISGSVSQIDVAVGYVSGVNSFYVALYTNSSGLPGTELARWDNQSGVGCPNLVSITGISGLSLTAGQSYWLVVGPMSLTSTTYERWRLNSTSAMGVDLYSHDGGSTWISNGTQTLGAFDILH